MRRTLTGLLLLAIVSLAPGQPAPRPVKLAFITSDPGNYWKMAEAGIKKAAEEFKAEVQVIRPKEQSADEQLRIVNDLVSKKIDGLAICLTDFKKQYAPMAKLALSTPLAFYNCDLLNTKRVLAVASDHKQGGRLAAQVIREALPKGAAIALFTGNSQTGFSQERFQALATDLGIADPDKDLKSKDGKYRLVYREPVPDGNNPMQARENVREALNRLKNEPHVCLVGLWAYHGPAILAVVKEMNLTGKVTILAYEEEGDTLLGIEDGHIYATLIQNPQIMGYKLTQALTARLRNEPLKLPQGGLEWIPHRVVTKTGEGGRVKSADLYEELLRIYAP